MGERIVYETNQTHTRNDRDRAAGDDVSGYAVSVICTILVPILLWGYLVIYQIAKGKNEKELQETLQRMEDEKEDLQTDLHHK